MEEEKWECEICGKVFNNRQGYWKHNNKKKTPCISKEQVKQLVENLQSTESRKHFYQMKTEQQEKEIQELKSTLQKFLEKNLRDNESINELKEELIDKIDEVNSSGNFYQTNNVYISNDSSKHNYINLSLSTNGNERLDHISDDMMLGVLEHEDFDDSLKNLVGMIYFNPNAPQNYCWCVMDTNAVYGAIEYNHETNLLEKSETVDVINKSVNNVMFRVTDILNKLETNHPLNKRQVSNCNRMFNLLGTDLNTNQITKIKEIAYEEKDLPKSVWKSLGVMQSAKPLTSQCHMGHFNQLDKLK